MERKADHQSVKLLTFLYRCIANACSSTEEGLDFPDFLEQQADGVAIFRYAGVGS